MIDQQPNTTATNRQITRAKILSTCRSRLPWDAKLGIALIVLGLTALVTMGPLTIASVMRLGWLLLVSGIVEIAHGLRVRRPEEFLLHSVPGVAGAPVGLLIATHPEAGYASWVLLFASYFTVLGLFELLSALKLRFARWRWAMLAGVITLLLGTMLWTGGAWLGLWFISVALGGSLIMRGVMFIGSANAKQRSGQSCSTSQLKSTEATGISFHERPAAGRGSPCSPVSSLEPGNLSQSAFRR